MYVYPGKTTPDFGPSLSGDTPYGRLILKLRSEVAQNASSALGSGIALESQSAQEALRIFEGRATIIRYFTLIPNAHYWINLRKDKEGLYWDIGVHPDCADYLGHFESVERGLGGARYKVALKEIK